MAQTLCFCYCSFIGCNLTKKTHTSFTYTLHNDARTDSQTLPTNRRQRAYNNGTLVIEQLQRLEDAGTYTCMAQNKQKQTARRNVEIQVLGKSVNLAKPLICF